MSGRRWLGKSYRDFRATLMPTNSCYISDAKCGLIELKGNLDSEEDTDWAIRETEPYTAVRY
jgi:hypothetical protein